MESENPYVIRVKPGNGKLYVGTENCKFSEIAQAQRFNSEDANAWLELQDEPFNYTIINVNTKQEYTWPDGSPRTF